MDTDAITGYICVTIKIRRRMNFNARGFEIEKYIHADWFYGRLIFYARRGKSNFLTPGTLDLRSKSIRGRRFFKTSTARYEVSAPCK